MTDTNAGPAAGRENAQRTYDRRRARSAADTLATIPPNRWDEHTRSVIATLATISAPSRIDELLAGTALDDDATPLVVELDADEYRRKVDALEPRLFSWDELPEGTEDIGVAFGAELVRMGLTEDRCRRQHIHGTPELAAACDALEGPFTPVHDNGDYRA